MLDFYKKLLFRKNINKKVTKQEDNIYVKYLEFFCLIIY